MHEQDKFTTKSKSLSPNAGENQTTQEPNLRTGYSKFPYIISREVSPMAAVVYGEIQRYANGHRGVCQAKFETIAANIGVHPRTVTRCVRALEASGYIHDRTPKLVNRPHTIEVTNLLIEQDETMMKLAARDAEKGEGRQSRGKRQENRNYAYDGIIEGVNVDEQPDNLSKQPDNLSATSSDNLSATSSDNLSDEDYKDSKDGKHEDNSSLSEKPKSENPAVKNREKNHVPFAAFSREETEKQRYIANFHNWLPPVTSPSRSAWARNYIQQAKTKFPDIALPDCSEFPEETSNVDKLSKLPKLPKNPQTDTTGVPMDMSPPPPR